MEKLNDRSDEKGMTIDVYRSADGYDATNNGISSKHTRITLIGDGVPKISYPTKSAPAMKLEYVSRFKMYKIVPIEEKGWFMFGGNFGFSSDSRFPSVSSLKSPIKIFDRKE